MRSKSCRSGCYQGAQAADVSKRFPGEGREGQGRGGRGEGHLVQIDFLLAKTYQAGTQCFDDGLAAQSEAPTDQGICPWYCEELGAYDHRMGGLLCKPAYQALTRFASFDALVSIDLHHG